MYLEIIKAVWVFLPAATANSIPVVAKRYNWLACLDKPLDMDSMLGGSRILGDHKTWRGLILGISAGIITAALQQLLANSYSSIDAISLIDWETNNPVTIGALLGFGALAGDAAKSFLKRRLNINPGETFLIFDQVDYILGALFFLSLKVPLSSLPIIQIVITWTMLHVLSTLTAWKVGIKEKAI
jgi:CDP-2,3-bis-(O-geranylgeranyl)-sn-glycerol synthase